MTIVSVTARGFGFGFALAATLALAACDQSVSRPTLANAPQTQTPQTQPPQTGPAAAPAGSPQVDSPQADSSQVAYGGGQAYRPPQLPSLEDLLGRLPKAVSDEAAEPPVIPGARGMRVALLLPLSGANQRVGSSLLNAASMALFDFAGPGFEVIVQDTKGTPQGAAEAARLAIGDGAQLIVGPLLANSVRAVSGLASAANVPVMAFSSDRTIVGGDVYTMGFFPGDEVRRVVDFTAAKGARRFGLLAPQGAYGDAVLNALQAQAFTSGIQVTSVEFYDPQAHEFSAPVKRIANYDQRHAALLAQRRELEARDDEASKAALKRLENLQTIGDPPFDALLVADGGKRLIAVAAMLPFYDIDPKRVKILGTGQWDEQDLGGEPALVGGWYAAPDPKVRQAFSDRYLEAFGNRPHRLATLAYDAMALAVVLAQQGGAQPYVANTLRQPGGFAGRDGIFRFLQDGAVERGLSVLQVERHAVRVVDAAPNQFAH